jgi:DeoR/GlpR family transcriptional regulator of sugar metabolism
MISGKNGIIRTIGGAHRESPPHEASFREKQDLLWDEKLRIAQKAASLVSEGDVIGLTGGTTTFLIAKALRSSRRITVVTNAVNIAMELAEAEDIQVVLTGGVMRSKSYELCGPLAESIVSKLNIGTMFVGVNGFSLEHGLTTFTESEAQIGRLMIERSRTVLAVFDRSKVDISSLFTIVPITAIHGCITDHPLEPDRENRLRASGIEIYYP